jgi:hypothetical protein
VGTTACGPTSSDNCGGISIPVVACLAGVAPLSVISPNGGESLTAGQQITTTWRSCGVSTGTNTDVYVKNLNTQRITYLNRNKGFLQNDGSETFTIPDDLVSGDYLLYVGIIGKDYLPIVADQSNSKITINNPKLVGTTSCNSTDSKSCDGNISSGTVGTTTNNGVGISSILEQRKANCDFGTTLNACAALYPQISYTDSTSNISKTILKRGMKSTKVGTIQSALTKRGYNLVSDGVFGVRTENAVKLFQKASGLYSDGIVGPLTEALLIE